MYLATCFVFLHCVQTSSAFVSLWRKNPIYNTRVNQQVNPCWVLLSRFWKKNYKSALAFVRINMDEKFIAWNIDMYNSRTCIYPSNTLDPEYTSFILGTYFHHDECFKHRNTHRSFMYSANCDTCTERLNKNHPFFVFVYTCRLDTRVKSFYILSNLPLDNVTDHFVG